MRGENDLDYGFKVTTHGRELLVACIDLGAKLKITRVAVGRGRIAEGAELADMHELIQYVADGMITDRSRKDSQFYMTVQYSNMYHPDIPAFPLTEFIIYAEHPETGAETDLIYATLGEYASIVPEFRSDIPPGVWSFPLVLVVSEEMDVSIVAPGGFARYEDLLGVRSDLQTEIAEKQNAITATGLLKRDIDGNIVAAVPGVDYIPASSGVYYKLFEAEEWAGGELRISQSEHGVNPTGKACMYQLRQRVDRTALDYYGSSAALGRISMIDAVKAALEANASAPGTCPTAEDGHVMLTWEQVQYYILEGVLAPVEEAMAKAAEKGFDWKDVDITGTPETVSLDELLKAAYVPALGGSAAQLDSLCTDKALQGLRLRRKADKAGTVERYDLEGCLSKSVWAVMEARVYWDLDTKELVIRYDAPFAGDLFVQGGSGGGLAGGGAGVYVLPAATSTRLGGVKASGSLTVDPDGTAHAVAEISPECFATGEEVDAVLDDVFGARP